MEVRNMSQAAAQSAAVQSAPAALQLQNGGSSYGVKTVEIPQVQLRQAQTDTSRKDPLKSADLSKDQAVKMTDEMNQFMARLNTDIQFAVHEETNRLMMKVVDQKNGEVLKEIPSQEMLDMIARISDYVGFLLDKKA